MNRAFVQENINWFNRQVKKHLISNKTHSHIYIYIYSWIDAFFCLLFCGAGPKDYFRYQFYRKKWSERRRFIVWRKGKRLEKKYSTSTGRSVLNDKRQLNTALQNYLGRRWLDLSTATEEQFRELLFAAGTVMLKPNDGAGGHGIFCLTREAYEQGFCIDEYRNYIAEELLVQHPAMAALNPTSVNSIRVMTFCGEIISGALKVGRGGSVVDNMSSGGMCGNIDLQSGIADSRFCDEELDEYLFHPESGAQLIGVQVPRWDEVKRVIGEAAKLFPEVQYIGWDCAVLPDGVAIIEANEAPGHDLSCQSTVQRGLYEEIRTIERERKRRRKA